MKSLIVLLGLIAFAACYDPLSDEVSDQNIFSL